MKKVILLVYLSLLLITSVSAQKIWMLAVADEMENPIGMVSKSDVEQMKEKFELLSQRLKYDWESVTLNEPSNFKSKEVLESLAKINLKSIDLLVFYYSGRVDNSKQTPLLKLGDWRENPLTLEDIASKISSKPGFLNGLVMVEGRDTIPPLIRGEQAPEFSLDPVLKSSDSLIISNLFFKDCGMTVVNSSKPRKTSYTLRGGVQSQFTTRFLTNLTGAMNYGLDTLKLNNLFEINLGQPVDKTSIDLYQEADWKQIPCNQVTQRAAVRPEKRWTPTQLREGFLKVSGQNSTQQSRALTNDILTAFADNNAPVLLKQFKLPTNGRGSPKLIFVGTISIQEYLKQLKSDGRKIEDIEIITNKLKYKHGSNKISSMEIQEILK